ncbi:hypothetical protein MMPV_006686 [Pyropia vietnamensis]
MVPRPVAAVAVTVAAAAVVAAATPPQPAAAETTFFDATAASGIPTTRQLSYGGPVVAPLANSLGPYDLLLPNHDSEVVWYYTNDGSGTFTRGSNLLPFVEDVHGLAVSDSDLDGLPEVLLTRGGSNGELPSTVELLSLRGGKFVNVTTSAGLRSPRRRGRAPRFVDVNGDGTPDVVVINFQGRNPRAEPFEDGGTLQLAFSNGVGGMHTPVENGAGLGNLPVERVLVTDLDGDNLPELITFPFFRIYSAVGGGEVRFVENRRWLNRIGRGNVSPAFAVAALDYNGDGLTDLYVARGNKPDLLLRNDGTGRFVDESETSGIPRTGNHQGVTVGDLDNDGWEDIFLVRHESPRQPDYILWNNRGDGTFTVSTSHGATTTPDNGRGDNAIAADLNGDGGLDLVVANGDFTDKTLAGSWSIYRNNRTGEAATNHYLGVRVGRSPSTNACNTGATVRIVDGSGRLQKRRIGTSGSSFSASLLNVAHFGLGTSASDVLQVVVRWPSGEEITVSGVAVDQVVTYGT